MKKRIVAGLLLVTMVMGCVACGADDNSKKTETQKTEGSTENGNEGVTEDPIKVTLLGAGYGDKSYWDSAKAGMERLNEVYGDRVEVNIVDMTADTKKWPGATYEAADSDADLIITGSFQQLDNMETIAPEYPDKDWVMFDSTLDFDTYDLSNVYNMDYRANESGYLAGMVAAHMTTTDNEGINPDKCIGFVGGMDNNPIIHDFLIGYIEGAKAVEPDIKIAVSYLGSFEDSAKAKETAMAQFNSNNVDVVFSVAGAAGTGCIEAAANDGKYVIGVDSDQTLLYEGRPEQNRIITSALKRVDESIIYAVGKYLDGDLPFGKNEVLGVKENAAGIVYNDILTGYVGEDFIKTLKEAEEKIASGEIKVTSSSDITTDQVNEMVQSVK